MSNSCFFFPQLISNFSFFFVLRNQSIQRNLPSLTLTCCCCFFRLICPFQSSVYLNPFLTSPLYMRFTSDIISLVHPVDNCDATTSMAISIAFSYIRTFMSCSLTS